MEATGNDDSHVLVTHVVMTMNTDQSLQVEQGDETMGMSGSKLCGYLRSNPAQHPHIRAPFAGSEGGSMMSGYLWRDPARRHHIRPASTVGVAR